jgi:hypothetical protein
MAHDQQCQCQQNKSASEVGHGHDPASLEAVGEGAGGQRQHEPRERVSCGDRSHRKWMRIHEESKEGDGAVTEAVSEARYREGRPEVAETSP